MTTGQLVDALETLPLDAIIRAFHGGLRARTKEELDQLIELVSAIQNELKTPEYNESVLVPPQALRLVDPDEFGALVNSDLTDADRALLGMTWNYCNWSEVVGGDSAEMKSRQINAALTEYGDRAISNISMALEPLLSSQPRLIRIIDGDNDKSDKIGPKPQRTYRLTRAGLLKAKNLIIAYRNQQNTKGIKS